MNYVPGESLARRVRRENGLPLEEVRRILLKLMDGLEKVHAIGFLHRDIKPGNILFDQRDDPVLIDFGAARLAIGAETMPLTAILTPGYAPMEQYSETARQGPYTDIYGLAAVAFYALTCQRPPDAVSHQRGGGKVLVAKPGDSPEKCRMIDAINWGMLPDEKERPQTVAAWREVLVDAVPLPGPVVDKLANDPPSEEGGDKTIPLTDLTQRQDKPNTGLSSSDGGGSDGGGSAKPPTGSDDADAQRRMQVGIAAAFGLLFIIIIVAIVVANSSRSSTSTDSPFSDNVYDNASDMMGNDSMDDGDGMIGNDSMATPTDEDRAKAIAAAARARLAAASARLAEQDARDAASHTPTCGSVWNNCYQIFKSKDTIQSGKWLGNYLSLGKIEYIGTSKWKGDIYFGYQKSGYQSGYGVYYYSSKGGNIEEVFVGNFKNGRKN